MPKASSTYQPIRMIISGGGTGGHLFPAIAIAQKVMELSPDSEIMFVGALGKIEMEKVPKYGFKIEGLNIAGFQRKNMMKNLSLPFKVISSLLKSRRIIKQFKPQIAVGVGGYASAAVVWMAEKKGLPTLLQEQNSFPGITNKILAPKAKKICVAFPGMEQFFQKEKLVITGNPVRENLKAQDQKTSLSALGLDPTKPTILSIGGSLGAGTINQSLEAGIKAFADTDINLIWQTGAYYFDGIMSRIGNVPSNIKISAFIEDMAQAYSSADLVISRAGALSISEITYLKKASILVPSPNVAEDHQTKNALALTERGAAILIKDSNAKNDLVNTAIALVQNKQKLQNLSNQADQLSKRNAATEIAEEIFKLSNGH